MSRAKNLANNIKWSYIGTFSTIIVGFAVRTVFIYSLGKTMLGLNSLFASVIGVLSIAELGIGAILNTQLYRPIANCNYDEVVAIIQLYRKIYTAIAGVIAGVGLALIPVLKIFVKGAEDVEHVYIYYLFFLFNTVISYFSIYRYSISNAEQKNYIETNVNTVFTLVMYIGQIIALMLFSSYFAYLTAQSLSLVAKFVFTKIYMDREYPILKIKEKKDLNSVRKLEIKKNLFAGVVNKFADSAVNQTDSMIISAFVNVNVLGMVSNYTTLRGYLEKFSKPLLDNMGSIVGNFVHTETIERKKLLIKALQLYAFAIYGYLSLVLLFLSTPFVKIWLGEDFVITNVTILLLSSNLMLSGIGDRPYVIFKNAHGNFYNDWFVVLASAIANLIVSIALAIPLGLNGVFIGTTASILVSIVWRPLVYYKQSTGESVFYYFGRLIRNCILIVFTSEIINLILRRIPYPNIYIELITKVFIVTIVFFIVFTLFFVRTDEFKYIFNIARGILHKRK